MIVIFDHSAKHKIEKALSDVPPGAFFREREFD